METFSWQPNWQQKRKKKPEKYSITFGDGYSQKTGVGVVNNRPEYNLVFTGDYTKINDIDAFLSARGGYEQFFFFYTGNIITQVYCPQWEVNYDEYNNLQLTATFLTQGGTITIGRIGIDFVIGTSSLW